MSAGTAAHSPHIKAPAHGHAGIAPRPDHQDAHVALRQRSAGCCCRLPQHAAADDGTGGVQPTLPRSLAAEFLGTWVMMLFGVGSVAEDQFSRVGPGPTCAGAVAAAAAASNTAASSTLAVALAWGLGVFFGVVVAARASGAHLNPAITVALAVHGRFPWARVPLYATVQLVAAFAACPAVWIEYMAAMRKRATGCCGGEEQALNISSPCAVDGIFVTSLRLFEDTAAGFYDQVLGTFVLVVAVMAIGRATEPAKKPAATADGPPNDGRPRAGHSSTAGSAARATEEPLVARALPAPPAETAAAAPSLVVLGSAAAVAAAVVAIGLSLGYDTGYALNPARDLGPRLWLACAGFGAGVFTSAHAFWWVPVAAPLVGAVLGGTLFRVVFGWADTAAPGTGGDRGDAGTRCGCCERRGSRRQGGAVPTAERGSGPAQRLLSPV